MAMKQIIFNILLHFLVVFGGEITHYNELAGYRDTVFRAFGTTQATTLLHMDNCWRICYRDKLCASFYVNSYTMECRLMSGILHHLPGPPENGWKYYAVDNACPVSLGYTYNTTADLCFKLTDSILDTDAEAMCNADGARVIQITRLEQQTVIADFLKALDFSSSPSIDGRKNITSNSWADATFRDGTTVDVFFWGSAGEPTDDKECIKLGKTNNFTWTGSLCTKYHVYICEVVM